MDLLVAWLLFWRNQNGNGRTDTSKAHGRAIFCASLLLLSPLFFLLARHVSVWGKERKPKRRKRRKRGGEKICRSWLKRSPHEILSLLKKPQEGTHTNYRAPKQTLVFTHQAFFSYWAGTCTEDKRILPATCTCMERTGHEELLPRRQTLCIEERREILVLVQIKCMQRSRSRKRECIIHRFILWCVHYIRKGTVDTHLIPSHARYKIASSSDRTGLFDLSWDLK